MLALGGGKRFRQLDHTHVFRRLPNGRNTITRPLLYVVRSLPLVFPLIGRKLLVIAHLAHIPLPAMKFRLLSLDDSLSLSERETIDLNTCGIVRGAQSCLATQFVSDSQRQRRALDHSFGGLNLYQAAGDSRSQRIARLLLKMIVECARTQCTTAMGALLITANCPPG